MTKRCNLCARKLTEDGKCTNSKCPKYTQEQIVADLQAKIKN